MLHSVKDLTRYSIRATDGDVGRVRDVLFDDEQWTVRYLVVDTGRWLPGRQILISPYGIGKLLESDEVLTVSSTRAQIEQSPDIDVHQPISRRFESAYAQYYGYPYYWGSTGVWGMASYPFTPTGHVPAAPAGRGGADPFLDSERPDLEAVHSTQSEDVHLRSCGTVSGYTIDAIDGEIGHVDDFLIQDESWTVSYLIVSTSNWWFGNKVLISPKWVEAVSWSDSKAVINLTRESIRKAPTYDPDAMFDDRREASLHEHYGRRP